MLFPARPSGDRQWLRLASEAIPAYVAAHGAVVWPEVEAQLSENGWAGENLEGLPADALGVSKSTIEGWVRKGEKVEQERG